MSHEPTWPQDATMPAGIPHRLTRREWLVSAAALAAVAGSPPLTARSALAQTPKRGGTLTLRLWDPPHWDPYLIIAFKTQIPYTFTHSRLLKHKAGPAIQPGTFPLEGDLAESWSQTDETTYVFKLRRGVRFHPKPPVNGRELTADDVVYSVERFRTVTGNPQAYMLAAVDKVEALDRYTVRFTVKEPFAWFPDMIANPMTLAIIARECVEKFGDLKKAEAVVGTGPWMLDSYRPNVGYTLVRNPGYFLPGLPHIDRIEVAVDEDNASRMAAFLAGKYDLGWEFAGAINRTDWIQIKDQLKRRRPTLQTAEFPSNVGSKIVMRTDKAPFSDARVRRAVSHAVNRQAIIDVGQRGRRRVQRRRAERAQGLGAARRPARRGLALLQVRSRRSAPPARRGRLSARILDRHGLSQLRIHPPRGRDATRAQGPQVGGHRGQAQPEGVRRLHLEHRRRQLRGHLLRARHALPRSRQLPVHDLLPRVIRATSARSTTRSSPTS